MQCYTDLIPPSGVTHALWLPFTSADSSNLVVAKTSLLQIFCHKKSPISQDPKLVLVAEFNLSGTITGLGRVKTLNSRSGGESLLIAFRDAKLSLVEWRPDQLDICTASIHYYENETLQDCPWNLDVEAYPARLTVDPSSRCALFNFGIGKIAIIPFLSPGDDLAMDDEDDNDDFETERPQLSSAQELNGHSSLRTTPYEASFVWPLTKLDTSLLHPHDLGFLYEYRQPTVAILYSASARSAALQFERKDVTSFAAYEIDLDRRTSTKLFSVSHLPNDLNTVVPLPLPIGGALLIGDNELVHVEQGGKTNAVSVNEFARQSSSFPMADQSECRLRLEGCQVEQMSGVSGDMLMVLSTGEMAIISFRIDGRSVSGISVRKLDGMENRNLTQARSSCMTSVGPGRIFVGSEDADSLLLSTTRKSNQLKKYNSRFNLVSQNSFAKDSTDDEDDQEGDDDDLYAEAPTHADTGKVHDVYGGAVGSLRLLDRLPNLAPIKDVALGRSRKRQRDVPSATNASSGMRLELVVVSGSGRAGGVAVLSRKLRPQILYSLNVDHVTGLWALAPKRRKTSPTSEDVEEYDEHVIMSKVTTNGNMESVLYSVSGGDIVENKGTEFDRSAGNSVEIGPVFSGLHTVQVLDTEVRVYGQDFGLAQIWPISDEDDGIEAKAVSASFADPYVLILKDDSSLLLLKADESGELDEVELPLKLSSKRCISAVLFDDQADFFNTRRCYRNDEAVANGNHILTLCSADGYFSMHSLPDLSVQIFSCEGLSFLPTVLAAEVPLPKHWKIADTVVEIVIAPLGDAHDKEIYLVIRTGADEIVVYQPFASLSSVGTFRFRKISSSRIAGAATEAAHDPGVSRTKCRHNPMRALDSVGELSMIFVPGESAALICKHAYSPPRVHGLANASVRALCSLHTTTVSRGFLFVDDEGNLHQAQLPVDADFGGSEWVTQKANLGEEVQCLTYFDRTHSYVVATSEELEFQLPQDDEWHSEWQDENLVLPPRLKQGSIRLFGPRDWKRLDSYPLEEAEVALCMKTLSLEMSEETHDHKNLIVIGTGITKGENVMVRGHIYIFDVVDVVPAPGVPDTDLRLKLLAKEEVKGAVTALSEVGTQGFILAAQGQKCMVRGLKEDLSILPVAFMDMRYYVKVVKELKGTGLCILGDGMSGLWLTGYSEEPYKLQLLGREHSNLDVTAADFLPDGKHLFIISADGDGALHVLQYDPEHPKSERGTKLLHRSVFHTGSYLTTMTLLPRTLVSTELANLSSSDSMEIDSDSARQQVLVTTQDGGLALITPLSESTYRRLSALQNLLITNTEQPCGLNPRAYRAVETDGIGGRAVIDGDMVRKWLDQSTQHKSTLADKAGGTVWEVKGDLESISGGGLGFLE